MLTRPRAILLCLGVTACGSARSAGGTPVDGGGQPESAAQDAIAPAPDAGAMDSTMSEGAAPSPDAGPTDPGPFPLGATLGPSALHLRVRADAATRLEVDLYAAATGVDEATAVVMTRAAAGQPWAADIPYTTLSA